MLYPIGSPDSLSSLHRLLEALRAKRVGRDQWMALCPAHPDRKPSLSIGYREGRILLHCFAGCPSERVLWALGLTWRDLKENGKPWWEPVWREWREGREREASLPSSKERWERWWKGARPDHPLLRRYLAFRGLSVPPPSTLRLALWRGTPLMLARIEGPDGALVGLHLTKLAKDGRGRKTKRLAKGSQPKGGAIRLYPLEEGKPLALTEGIETALAVRELFGLPVWACVSAGGLKEVVLPPEVQEVHIYADHDPAGLQAAEALARKLSLEGRKVYVGKPLEEGWDFLDVLVARKGAGPSPHPVGATGGNPVGATGGNPVGVTGGNPKEVSHAVGATGGSRGYWQ